MTSESQGPVDFASSHLLASEDSNSLYEPGAKRMKTEWLSSISLFSAILCIEVSVDHVKITIPFV